MMRAVVESDASPVRLWRAGRFIVRTADQMAAVAGWSEELRIVRTVGMGLIGAAGKKLEEVVRAAFRDLARASSGKGQS